MALSKLYEAVGGDLEDALERLGDTETIKHFSLMFPDDPSYSLLLRSLRENDIRGAFHAAHTLKGVSQSLGFKRLGDCSEAVCEKLRNGIRPPEMILRQLETEYGCVINAIDNFKKGV